MFLLVVLSGLSSGTLPSGMELLRSTIALLSFMITIFVAGKLFIPKLLRKFAVSGNQQEMIMLIFCLIMGTCRAFEFVAFARRVHGGFDYIGFGRFAAG